MKFWPMTAAKIMPELDLTSVNLPAKISTRVQQLTICWMKKSLVFLVPFGISNQPSKTQANCMLSA